MKMKLPQVETPVYTLVLPSTKKTITYRPFLVKEEKVLALAYKELEVEQNNPKLSDEDKINIILSSIKEVVKSCTFNKVDIENWSAFDLDYFYLMLRARSKGVNIDASATCGNIVGNVDGEDIECDHKNSFTINIIDNLEVDFKNAPDKNIKFAGTNIGMVLKYPTINDVARAMVIIDNSDIEGSYAAIKEMTECIFQGEEVFTDYTDEEFKDFIEHLRQEDMEQIQNFFKNQPVVKLKFKFTCKKCGHEHDAHLEGIQNFLE